MNILKSISWMPHLATATFASWSIAVSAAPAETPITLGQPCRALGVKYAKCAVTTGNACPKELDFVEPDRCKAEDSREFNLGIADGVRLEREHGIQRRVIAPSVAQAAPASAPMRTQPKFSAAECRLMAREMPAAARAQTSHDISYDVIRRNILEHTDTPGADDVVLTYLGRYNEKSVKAFAFEMAGDFEKACNSGTIRRP